MTSNIGGGVLQYKVDIMPNGRIFVLDRKSGLSGGWNYKFKDGKIIIGGEASGDLSRSVKFNIRKIADEIKEISKKEVVFKSKFDEWLITRENFDAGSSPLANNDALSSINQSMPDENCCSCDFQNWIDKRRKKKLR